MPDFLDQQRTLENSWRAVILFGQNVASHKFALAKSLIDLGAAGQTAISLEDLAEPFSRHTLEHLARTRKCVQCDTRVKTEWSLQARSGH